MKNAIQTIGTRKQAIARASLRPGKGHVTVNGQALEYYADRLSSSRIIEPLLIASDVASKVDISVNVNGGGVNGQADAMRLAIARALVQFDAKLKKPFMEYDRLLLVADVRQNETSKPNDSKPRAKRQKSYR
jgi:small subunit ribosomal protein S9